MTTCTNCGAENDDAAVACKACKRDMPGYDWPAKSGRVGAPVRITDVDLPFGSMVAFMAKWAIASIPAMLILLLFGMLIVGFVGGIATL